MIYIHDPPLFNVHTLEFSSRLPTVYLPRPTRLLLQQLSDYLTSAPRHYVVLWLVLGHRRSIRVGCPCGAIYGPFHCQGAVYMDCCIIGVCSQQSAVEALITVKRLVSTIST